MAEYIERDVLLKQMQANFQQASWYGCEEPMYPIVEETILNTPAADVAPVVHGRWKYHKYVGKYECMECGHFVKPGTDRNYCPKCGAKMEEQLKLEKELKNCLNKIGAKNMTIEEAIKILEKKRNKIHPCDAKAFNLAIAALLAQQGAKESEWISVGDRLPPEKGEYLVTYHPCYWNDVSDEVRIGIDNFRGKTTWAKKKYQRVTHWMPLPEPPVEAKEV